MLLGKRSLLCLLLSAFLFEAQAIAKEAEAHKQKPLIIAHRGASGYRPEHTLRAYELAIDLGADYIEPDLVSSKDGILIARHENEISGTTDVAEHPEFAARKTTKNIDGNKLTGWFTEDFSFAELKTLRAKERLPELRQRNTIYNGLYEIPSFQEIMDLVKRKNKEKQKRIGVYIEAKHPSYFRSLKLSPEKKIVEILEKNGYKNGEAPVFIQCFEVETLKQLHKSSSFKLIQLIEENSMPYDLVLAKDPRKVEDLLSPSGLSEIAKYAYGIGPSKNLILPRDKDANLLKATSLVSDAHKAGLAVHPWTFRNENSFLALDLRSSKKPEAAGEYGKALSEYKMFFALDVDGVFTENPDTAREALD
ncbi:MAG: glycerophosphodiester phosphodiesterase [Candidatus Obscuribacterales bacterium]|nr:glycerophosphodiester phosphodiesterase [Candidatus Obscuribacterales bacterium]